jgi:alpha-mannosidase
MNFKKTIRNSTVTQFISLYADDPLVYGRIDMDWKDHNVTTKLAFPLNLLNKDAWFEIPYAAISRKAIPGTAADKAKFEVSAHRWVDYTNEDGAAGVSLLNDSKYGFDVKKNVLRMTLLRSPITPDPEADIGFHTMSYALYPHAGDWRAADTPRRGAEFNAPPYIVMPGAHDGELPASFSFFSADADNVMLTSVKRGEDGNGIILRLVETEGRKATARITIPWPVASASDVNLIADPIPSPSAINIEGAALSLELGPFEIRSIKLTL